MRLHLNVENTYAKEAFICRLASTFKGRQVSQKAFAYPVEKKKRKELKLT